MQLPVAAILRHRKTIVIVFLAITLVSLILIPLISVNYDMQIYLPADSETKSALNQMTDVFGLNGSAQAMVTDISLTEAVGIKQDLSRIKGVKSVIFLDDWADLDQPIDYLDQKLVESFYRGSSALFQITFTEGDYGETTRQALTDIRLLLGDHAALAGPAVRSANMSQSIGKELGLIMAFVIPVFLIILLLFTDSLVEAVLFLVVIGVAVLINMGTNSFFRNVSFMTHMSVAVLQMAISMDYSIFLLHRFGEERRQDPDLTSAMLRAVTKSFPAILASALTTMAGFLSLTVMRYTLGRDMGLVLTKGILLSLISVMVLLPVLTLIFIRIIDRTTHRNWLPTFKHFSHLTIRARWIVVPIWLVIAVLAFAIQSHNTFAYGESAIMSSAGSRVALDQDAIEKQFGLANPLVIMIPADEPAREHQLTDALGRIAEVKAIQSLSTLADPALARPFLPDSVKAQFQQKGFARIILSLNVPEESAQSFQVVDEIRGLSEKYFGAEAVLLGSTTSVQDIRQVIEHDYFWVNILSIAAVALILLLTFRNLLLPVLLILVIESAIWLNMAIPWFADKPLSFIGYMIVSAIQLGATIDYAILMTSRYLESRQQDEPRQAARKAIRLAGGSILTSGSILALAGIVVWLVSTTQGIKELGLLIGRGAVFSAVLVLVVLPQILALMDFLIQRAGLKRKEAVKS